ncbi:MAG: arylamine N-acetyltransferase, partial [Chthoniobacterales bacterium]
LFLLALRSIGFKTRPLAARVLLADETYSARGHQLTGIEILGRKWIADVGYGGNGLIEAIPLEPGLETDQTLDRFRIVLDEDFGFRLEHALGDGWRTLYAFSLDPYSSLDYRTMNYFSSQSPDSIFTRIPFCTLPTAEERRILFGNTLKIRTPKKQTVIPVETIEVLRDTLKEWFGLSFPDDFPLPQPQPPPANR